MGLFDRLFGRKEEPQIEDVVKEALENLNLTEEESAEELETTAEKEQAESEVVGLDQETTTSEVSAEPMQEQEEIETASSDQALAETVGIEEKVAAPTEPEVLAEPSLAENSEPAPAHPSAMEAYYAELQARIAEASASNQVPAPESQAEEPIEEMTAEVEEPVIQETVQEKYDRSLRKTRSGFGARLNAFFANFRSVDEEFFEELEELLIMSDVGVQVASNLTEELRYEAKLENAKKPEALRRVIIEKLVDLYEKDGNYNESINFQDGLTVMLFVGVNGVGKTTSIGKLAHKYKQEGNKVMLVAADTFRAGAVAQLAEWGRRVDVPVVTGPEKSDPASVVYDGMERAMAEGVDILMIDTAGRLQNKDNLMAELEKIGRIIKRVVPEAPHETFLALDASTGQNALVQAKEFSKITPVTGIVLTKIDGTARGGVVLAIREELDIPVKLIGFGEKIDDIGEFNSENFMKGLLEGLV